MDLQVNTNYYLVCWWEDIPLGHCWIDKPISTGQILSRIWDSIKDTIRFYCLEIKTKDSDFIASLWKRNEYALFLQKLDRLFSEYTLKQKGTDTGLSLIICTRNRTKPLRRCLSSLANLSVKPEEVIVVDNAPGDSSTRKLVSAFPGVKYILEPEKGLDRARNTGWQHASCPIVAYTDDDVRLHKDWVIQMKNAFNHPRVQGVTGLVFAEELKTSAQVQFEKYWSFNRGYKDLNYGPGYLRKHIRRGMPIWNIGAGASMAFRRSIFEVLGGFDNRLDVGASGCSGDSEMWYRIVSEGWVLHYTPRAIAYHTHRESMKALKRQIFYYMRGNTSSVLVQYQRYNHPGNLYYLFKSLPIHQVKSLYRKFRYPTSKKYDTVLQEISGGLSGIFYFIQNRKLEERKKTIPLLLPDNDDWTITVILTTHNQGPSIKDAIKSVLAQTHQPEEFIVVDDGSTDETKEIAALFPELRYIHQKKEGKAAARNIGIFNSSSNLILFLEADHRLYPNAIAENLKYFKQHPESALVSGRYDSRQEPGQSKKAYKHGEPYTKLPQDDFKGRPAATIYRKEVFNYFLFDETLRVSEDYNLFLKISERFKVLRHGREIAAYCPLKDMKDSKDISKIKIV